jgi:hypothetical protein
MYRITRTNNPMSTPQNISANRGQTQDRVAPLRELHVTPAAPGVIGIDVAPPPAITHLQPPGASAGEPSSSTTASDRGRAAMIDGLRGARSIRDSKIGGILDYIGPEGLGTHGGAFRDRGSQLDAPARRWLASQLHYSRKQRGATTPQTRLAARAAVALAFAKGASHEQVESLRKGFDQAAPATRRALLEELRIPGPYVGFCEVDPADMPRYVRELSAANQPPPNDLPSEVQQQKTEAYEEINQMLHSFGGRPQPSAQCKDYRLATAHGTVALMRLSYGRPVDAHDRNGNAAVGIMYMVAHPESRGVGRLLIERALQESTQVTGGEPCVVLHAGSLGLWNRYGEVYGFRGLRLEYDDRACVMKMDLHPAASDKWRRVDTHRYTLHAPRPVRLPDVRLAQGQPPAGQP